MSSCQRSASASHFPLFLGSVLARSKHHNSIVLQSLSLIVTPSLTLFSTSLFSPFLQTHYIFVKKFCQAPTKKPGPYCVQMRDDIWTTLGETTSISPVAPVSPVAIDWAHTAVAPPNYHFVGKLSPKRSDRIIRATFITKLAFRPTNWAAV